MKTGMIVLATFASLNSFAGVTYICTDTKNPKKVIDLTFNDLKSVQVIDSDGDEINLRFSVKTGGKMVFADDGYDGYGGFIEVSIPANFTLGRSAPEKFNATYYRETFSELGRVGTEKIKGKCVKSGT